MLSPANIVINIIIMLLLMAAGDAAVGGVALAVDSRCGRRGVGCGVLGAKAARRLL